MNVRLRSIEDGSALVLEQSVLEQLGLAADGEVEVTIEGGRLIVTPVESAVSGEVKEQTETIIAERAAVLRRLAE